MQGAVAPNDFDGSPDRLGMGPGGMDPSQAGGPGGGMAQQPLTPGAGFSPEHGGLFTSEHMAMLQGGSGGGERREKGQAAPQRSATLFTPEQEAAMGLTPPAGGSGGNPTTPNKRGPTLELDGYSLSTTPSGLSVLVPTGTRKVTIEAPPGSEQQQQVPVSAAPALPPGLAGPAAANAKPKPPGL